MELYLGLGSNLGDRMGYLQRALDRLWPLVCITAVSPVYETVPWGPEPDQPLFLNACVAAETSLPPAILLHSLKQLERAIGRSDAHQKWGPHTIDIDLLFYGDWVLKIGARTIPHRQIKQRPFVLVPLADVAPAFVHPVHQQSVTELLAEVDTEGVNRYSETLVPSSICTVAV